MDQGLPQPLTSGDGLCQELPAVSGGKVAQQHQLRWDEQVGRLVVELEGGAGAARVPGRVKQIVVAVDQCGASRADRPEPEGRYISTIPDALTKGAANADLLVMLRLIRAITQA